MIKGLKAHLYKKKLKEISRRNSLGSKPSNNAFKNVLLFFDATDGAERKVIQMYATKLERSGKIVKMFAYLNSKEADSGLGINHYVNKDINWYQVPSNEDLILIQNKTYDVMISLLSELKPHHKFVIESVKVAMKIGPSLHESQDLIFDFSVDHQASLGIPELIKNIKSSIQLLSNVEYI